MESVLAALLLMFGELAGIVRGPTGGVNGKTGPNMTRTCSMRWLWVAASLPLLAGCKQEDADRLGRVGRLLGQKAEAATAQATGQVVSSWQTLRANAEEANLDDRVRARLRWEKSLAGTAVEVQAVGGQVRLSGNVANLTQRRRVVELAESTVGVDRVIDQLTIIGP
jgi:hypothetical protein